MTNHRYPENLDWSYDKLRKVFVLKALNDIRRGEEVYLSYGKSINQIQFLLYYGFIESGTKFHRSVEFGINEETTPRAQAKMTLLKNWGDTFSFELCQGLEEENLHLLVQWARFCVYDGEKDDELIKAIE